VVIASWCQGRDHVWPEISSLGEPNPPPAATLPKCNNQATEKKTSDTADPNTPPRLDTGKGRGEPNLDAEVAGADDVLDLPRHKHGLELGGQVGRPVRDVQIPERQRHPR
jgi:hypothetical protein